MAGKENWYPGLQRKSHVVIIRLEWENESRSYNNEFMEFVRKMYRYNFHIFTD